MIQLIEGEPGSGKSFYFCNYLKKFVQYDALYNEYVLDAHVLIITNVEGLKVSHWSLDYCLEGKTLEQFFSIANFEAIQKKTGKTHIILAIDEAHDYFPDGFKNASIYSFFAFHRHIGLDVFLMCQGLGAMSRLFLPLLEYIVRATPRTSKMTKKMKYNMYTKKGKFLYPRSAKCDPLVFGMYKSFRSDEKNKPISAVKIWVAFVSICFVLGVGFFYFAITSLGDNSKAMAQEKIKMRNSSSKPRPVAGAVSAPAATPVVARAGADALVIRLYELEGWVLKDGLRWYLIAGRHYPDSGKFGKFDEFSRTVEYYGANSLNRAADTALLRGRGGEVRTMPSFGIDGGPFRAGSSDKG